MKKKYIDNFYNTTIKLKEYEVFALTLPITLLHKDMFNKNEHFFKTTYDLLHSDISVLASLYFNKNALSPTELYDATLFSSGGMTKVLKKLEDRKLIEKIPSLNDKRSMLISLTNDGETLIKECMESLVESKEKLFNILTQKEKKDLQKILAKVIYSMI
ncbi:MarR family winged helix-turn-helix transcriptional regulator [Arcobacter caeni]|uniref:MarR family transcriptional regulator n=1 Tax=Arcobacter caeni TaxID=1912877 RepID=A0A363CXE9_9BACT|nr:MarR family transcriptional regulator [Arcobacter caeni]PUE63722.1 MarR family transcriptional regulator [Arcobacter caeni]